MFTRCRLLYLVGQLRAGGLERQLYFLLHHMDRERYRPAVVAWNLDEDDTYVLPLRKLGVALYSLSGASSGAAKVRAFRRMVIEMRPEVVHSYSFYTNVAAWWATLGTKAVVIGAVQSDFITDKKQSGPWLGSLSARFPRDQIFNSLAAAENARGSRSPFVPGRPFVVRNGLDLHLFRSVPPAQQHQVCVLGVGSLFQVKRWDRLLRAAGELRRRGLDCIVRIAGAGPLQRQLEQQCRDLGVAEYVEFMGHADNVPELMAKATFLTHTSQTEGCPNVVMEAMACGRAVVATDAGDTACLIEEGKTGFVVPRGDDAALVDRMATLIADGTLCRRMGEAGRIKAEREFGVHRLVSETLAVYRSLGWPEGEFGS
jgi:glycosyltransferase involved in cell wall biosynthesis